MEIGDVVEGEDVLNYPAGSVWRACNTRYTAQYYYIAIRTDDTVDHEGHNIFFLLIGLHYKPFWLNSSSIKACRWVYLGQINK